MTVDIGNVCEDCANAWAQTYLRMKTDITYNVVDPPDCEECEGDSLIDSDDDTDDQEEEEE